MLSCAVGVGPRRARVHCKHRGGGRPHPRQGGPCRSGTAAAPCPRPARTRVTRGVPAQVGPLLVSSDFVSDDAAGEALAAKLHAELTSSSGPVERKAEVVLLKNAVLMGNQLEEEKAERERAKNEALTLDPMLSRERRRGGAAFGTNVEDDEPDVHSKAAIARARIQAKEDAKRLAAAEAHMKQMLEMEEELSEARKRVARARVRGDGVGAVSVIESQAFALPNPGGGENLLDDCTLRLVAGHRYGLNGRNGKGKSTLLRHIAAQRVKGFPSLLSIHYVAQEIPLAVINEEVLPVHMVLRADVEREVLLQEQTRLERLSEEGEGSAEAVAGLADVMQRLMAIDADSAEARARSMLINLGFSEELLVKKNNNKKIKLQKYILNAFK